MFVSMRRTKEAAEQTRQIILDAALTVFSERGFHATRLDDIAQAADVTRGAIYHHFKNKAGLFITLMEIGSVEMNTVIGQAIETGGSFAEVGCRVMVNSWYYAEDNPKFRKIVTLLNLRTGYSEELSDFDQIRKIANESGVQFVAGLVHAGQDSGEVRSDIDATIIARSFLVYVNGVLKRWLEDTDAFSLRDEAQRLAQIWMDGVVIKS